MVDTVHDFAIVGAGIAGAALGWWLARDAGVVVVERETQPGVHSTGRSAAMFMATYGPPQVRALTRASRAFYDAPPDGFADVPLLAPRGVLYAAWQGHEAELAAHERELRATGGVVERIDAVETSRRVPVLRAAGLLGALSEPDAMDIDVAALHQGYLRGLRQAGGELRCGSSLQAARRDGGVWTLELADGASLRCRVLVDAAGAWADDVAGRVGAAALGLQPKRRSAFTFRPPDGLDVRRWPTVAAIDERWYFKPDAGQLLGSPANADPVPPHDVVAEELDIALGIDAIERHTTMTIRRPQRTWAGLRTFAPDGELVIGPDPRRDGLFWLAGQGGYGIQSAAGAAALAASLLLGAPLPEALRAEGVEAGALNPDRLPPRASSGAPTAAVP